MVFLHRLLKETSGLENYRNVFNSPLFVKFIQKISCSEYSWFCRYSTMKFVNFLESTLLFNISIAFTVYILNLQISKGWCW